MYKIIVIFAVFVAAGSQILLKKGALKHFAPFWKQYINPWVICGYALLGCALLLNIFCMSHGVSAKEVSTLESLSYFFVPCFSFIFLNESFSWKRIGAISIIVLGVLVFFI